MTGSVFMMVSIGVERCLAVYFPFSRIPLIRSAGLKTQCHKKRLFLYIFPVLLFSILLNIFKFLESKSYWKDGRVKLEIRELRYDPTYLIINGWVRFIVLGILPVGAIISLNCCIYWAVRRARLDMLGERVGEKEEIDETERKGMDVSTMRNTLKNTTVYRRNKWSKKLSASEQRLSIVLMMIAIIFILSSLPRIIIMMYDIIIIDTLRSCIDAGKLGEGFPVWNHILGSVSHVFLCLVPTANFLVYCLVGNKFRLVARQFICCGGGPRQAIIQQQGSIRSYTKATSLHGSVRRHANNNNQISV